MQGINFSDIISREAEAILESARQKKLKIATAESCTGGLIAAMLTAIPGSSDVFERGFVTYTNESKHQLLGVANSLFEQHGAVSEDVVKAMAEGALKHSLADVSVATTGVAGPTGGTEDKPVGLVYFAVMFKGQTAIAQKHIFKGDRHSIRLQAAKHALSLIELVL